MELGETMEQKETIKIKYLNDKIEKLCYIDGKSDWIDLRAAEDAPPHQTRSSADASGCGTGRCGH